MLTKTIFNTIGLLLELAGHFKNLFMKKILVTGGAGYIGSHTLVELSANNFEPLIVDNLCNTSIQNITGAEKIIGKHIPFYNVDCTNEEALNDVFEHEKNIQGVIHFAAYKSVEESIREPEKYHSNNIGSLQVLLNVMKKHKVENIILSSSCTVYGSPDVLPVSESTPFKKQNLLMVRQSNFAKNY